MVGAVVGKDFSQSASDMQFLGSQREASSMWLNVSKRGNLSSRHIWILPPAQMGRRSSKIATKKVSFETNDYVDFLNHFVNF